MSVFAPGMVNLWQTIDSYGIDPAPLFDAESINVTLPIDPCVRIPYQKIDRIRANAANLSGDEAFGLKVAANYGPTQLGALGYAWLASLTLRRAFQRLERFIRVVNDKAEVLIEDRENCIVIAFKLDIPSENITVRDDGALALVTKMSRAICGRNFRLQAVNFKHAEPKDLKPCYEFFGCPLNFDQPANELLIPLDIADKELVGANPELALLNDKVMTRYLARMNQHDVVARVQAALIDQLPNGSVTDDSVADSLYMSVRTLHRKLVDVDSNFKTILVEIRRSLADQYIMDNSLTLTEISLLLGFSEQSSFSRAFRKWTGRTPSEARQQRTDNS